MNWIKENKFLFGFIVVMLIGVGAGGWLVLGAKGKADEATEDYQRKMAELNRLQRLPIFPNQKNLDRIVAQQTDVNTEVSKLASGLIAQQIPVEEVSPEQFQDKLKAAVTAVKNKATQSNPAVKLPEPKFFLGFDPYETAPPTKEAAGVLARELKAIEWLCNQLIDNKITELKPLNREPLPEEKGKGKAQETKPAAAKPASGKPGDKPKPGGSRYEVDKHRIEFVFVTEQSRFRALLNTIVSHKGQFFIPRLIGVKNEKPGAPARVVEAAVPPPPVSGAPAAQVAAVSEVPAAVQSSYIVGEEKIEVTLVLELVDIREGGTK